MSYGCSAAAKYCRNGRASRLGHWTAPWRPLYGPERPVSPRDDQPNRPPSTRNPGRTSSPGCTTTFRPWMKPLGRKPPLPIPIPISSRSFTRWDMSIRGGLGHRESRPKRSRPTEAAGPFRSPAVIASYQPPFHVTCSALMTSLRAALRAGPSPATRHISDVNATP